MKFSREYFERSPDTGGEGHDVRKRGYERYESAFDVCEWMSLANSLPLISPKVRNI